MILIKSFLFIFQLLVSNLSLISKRCGEVKTQIFFLATFSIEKSILATEPFQLVHAIWIIL
jgi:hypothetical protein